MTFKTDVRPRRSLPPHKGIPSERFPKVSKVHICVTMYAEKSDEQNPRRANNGRKVHQSSPEAGPLVVVVAAVAAATAGVAPKWEAAWEAAICNAGEA